MAQSDLVIRIDDDLKTDGEKLLRSEGMDWSMAFSTFVAYSVKLGKFPFHAHSQVEDDPDFQMQYSAEDIKQDLANIKAGTEKTFPWAEVKREADALFG
jgi:addiction module RelB/DinJ family antitoxin